MTRPIQGWTVQATCPRCAGTLVHIADGRPDPCSSRAVARCDTCNHTYAAELTLTDVTNQLHARYTQPTVRGFENRTHGIRATYNAGCRCPLCRDAEVRYRTERRARTREAA